MVALLGLGWVAASSPAQAVLPLTVPAEGARGTHCWQAEGEGPVLLLMAGWTVEPAWAWTWARAVVGAALAERAPRQVCVVRGPADATFRRKNDIDVEALAGQLMRSGQEPHGALRVVAHSSGTFVAHHLFQRLRERGAQDLLARTEYFNLDGAIGTADTALDAALVGQLAAVHAVLARDARGEESANAPAMRELARLYPDRVRLHVLDASHSGCRPASGWCLHQVLITRRPHNPGSFDLARDYGQIDSDHPVQVDYLR